MFARLVDGPVKPGKRTELMSILLGELQPMLKSQPGFVDFVGLTEDTNPDEGVTVSFWTTKHDAEHFYDSAGYKAVMERIKPLMQHMTIRTFNVEASSFHHIAAAKTA